MSKFIQTLREHRIFILFFLFYLLYSFATYSRFGISWDESFVYERGKQLYQHLFIPKHNENANLILRSSQSIVGPTYNNSYATILYAFNRNESYVIYHLLNLLFASLIFVFSYLLLFQRYKKPLLALLGPLFIVLNPRFFGHIATNPKDMPFAVLYFISITIIYLLSSVKNVLLHVLILGFLFAFTQSSRVIGYTLYPVLFLYDLHHWYYKMRDYSNRKSNFLTFIYSEALYIGAIFIMSNSFMVITWPYIGSNYFKNFINVLTTSSKFPWEGNVFFMGKDYLSLDLPLYYLPVWLLITQPIFLVIGFFGSIILALKKTWRSDKIQILLLSPIVLNLLIYFLLKPTLYDGIRHYLFLLPFISVLAAICTIEVIRSGLNNFKYILLILIVINSLLVISTQIRLFPYHYIYFNELVNGLKGGSKNFETDYWNASFMEAISWLKNNKFKKDKKYSIYPCSYFPGMDQYLAENITYVQKYKNADYSICFTRFHEYKSITGRVVHVVTRDSVPLNYIFENYY